MPCNCQRPEYRKIPGQISKIGSEEILKENILTLLGAQAHSAPAPAPAAAATPVAMVLHKEIRHNRKAQGRHGGTGTVPSVKRHLTLSKKKVF
jgi:hypothetical protein